MCGFSFRVKKKKCIDLFSLYILHISFIQCLRRVAMTALGYVITLGCISVEKLYTILVWSGHVNLPLSVVKPFGNLWYTQENNQGLCYNYDFFVVVMVTDSGCKKSRHPFFSWSDYYFLVKWDLSRGV